MIAGHVELIADFGPEILREREIDSLGDLSTIVFAGEKKDSLKNCRDSGED